MKLSKGFTLIELLVVITIIAILAAILFPVFASAREKARESACLSNEKQLGISLLQYSQDFDETQVPPGAFSKPGWAERSYIYVKSTKSYTCPDDKTSSSNPQNIVISYSYNRNLAGKTLSQQTAPAMTVQMFEIANCQANDLTNPAGGSADMSWAGDNATTGVDGGWFYSGAARSLISTGPLGNPAHVFTVAGRKDPNAPTGRHHDGSNFLMADGHSKYLKGALVSPGSTPSKLGCDQDTNSACFNGNTGNAASTDMIGVPPKSFAATFSTL